MTKLRLRQLDIVTCGVSESKVAQSADGDAYQALCKELGSARDVDKRNERAQPMYILTSKIHCLSRNILLLSITKESSDQPA